MCSILKVDNSGKRQSMKAKDEREKKSGLQGTDWSE